MFELRDLECFLAIVEHKTFHRAAKVLNMAQPPLSRRIAGLERELGSALFSRQSRQIQLTEVGAAFAGEARTVLEQAALAARVAREHARGFRGHVRVAYPGSAGYSVVPLAMRSFRNAHAQATVTVHSILGHRQIDALRAGTIDVALDRGAAPWRDLKVTRLRADRFIVVLNEHHPLAARGTVTLESLAHEPFVALAATRGGGTPDLVRTICAGAGFVPKIVQEVDSGGMLAACVALGMGVALASQSLRALPMAGIAFREIAPIAPTADLSALSRTEGTNPLVPIFIEHLSTAAKTAF